MSKLFKVREWLTIHESASFISQLLQESVTENDVYRLMLDGVIQPSIHFVSEVPAKRLTDEEELDVKGIRGTFDLVTDDVGKVVLAHAIYQNDESVQFDDFFFEGISVEKVGDGAFRLFEATRIPNRQLLTKDFLYKVDDETGESTPVDANGNPIELKYSDPPLGEPNFVTQYIAAVNLPPQAIVCLRPCRIMGFVDSLPDFRDGQKTTIPGQRSETTYLNIIGGLLALMLSKNDKGTFRSEYRKQEAIIADLVELHGTKDGIAKSTLEGKFAAANRSLNAD